MSRLTIVFLTIFVDLIGFGIVLPLLPFYAQEFGATPGIVGVLIAVHPGMQFLAAPFWGRLSDRHGRRPILLIGLVGSGISYLIFAVAPDLTWLFASRIMAGVMGANVPVAQAYIADSTRPEDRARGMGLVGAAFGLGFVLGPAIGGALSHFGYGAPGYFAAALCFGNAGAAYFRLPETLTDEARRRAAERRAPSLLRRLALTARYARRPALGPLMAIYALFTFVFAAFTTVLPMYIEWEFGYGARHAGYLIAYWGLLMALVQGRMIGPVARRLGESLVMLAATALLAAGYAAFPLAHGLWPLVLALVPLALGTGLNWPALTSLASRYARLEEQGSILGVMGSLSSLSRMVGSTWGGWIFGAASTSAPLFWGAAIMAAAALIAVWFQARAPSPPPEEPEAAVPVGL